MIKYTFDEEEKYIIWITLKDVSENLGKVLIEQIQLEIKESQEKLQMEILQNLLEKIEQRDRGELEEELLNIIFEGSNMIEE